MAAGAGGCWSQDGCRDAGGQDGRRLRGSAGVQMAAEEAGWSGLRWPPGVAGVGDKMAASRGVRWGQDGRRGWEEEEGAEMRLRQDGRWV